MSKSVKIVKVVKSVNPIESDNELEYKEPMETIPPPPPKEEESQKPKQKKKLNLSDEER